MDRETDRMNMEPQLNTNANNASKNSVYVSFLKLKTHTPEIGADFLYQMQSGTKNPRQKSTWTTQSWQQTINQIEHTTDRRQNLVPDKSGTRSVWHTVPKSAPIFGAKFRHRNLDCV